MKKIIVTLVMILVLSGCKTAYAEAPVADESNWPYYYDLRTVNVHAPDYIVVDENGIPFPAKMEFVAKADMATVNFEVGCYLGVFTEKDGSFVEITDLDQVDLPASVIMMLAAPPAPEQKIEGNTTVVTFPYNHVVDTAEGTLFLLVKGFTINPVSNPMT